MGRGGRSSGSRTKSILDSIPPETDVGGAGGRSTFEALQSVDASWEQMKNMAVCEPPKMKLDFCTVLKSTLQS